MVQLAQVNVGRLVAPTGSPEVAEFDAAVDRVNALAEAAPGFVWRRHLVVGRDLVNVSVWETYEALHDFTYRGDHGAATRRRRDWFEPVPAPSTALWWVDDGTEPTVEQALARLEHLRRHGPTPQAFGLRTQFNPSGAPRGRRRGAPPPGRRGPRA